MPHVSIQKCDTHDKKRLCLSKFIDGPTGPVGPIEKTDPMGPTVPTGVTGPR